MIAAHTPGMQCAECEGFCLRGSSEENQSLAPAMADIACEVALAMRKFPTWPTDPLHALAVLGEEFGELTKAMLQLTYEPHKTNPHEVRTEALQTAAMALRLLVSLDRYEYRPGVQHQQETIAKATGAAA